MRQPVNYLQATTTKSRQRQSTCRRGAHTGALKLQLCGQRASLLSKLLKARQAELLSTSMNKSIESKTISCVKLCLPADP